MRLPDSFFLHNLPRGISVTVYKCIVYGKQKHRGFQGKETMQGCAPTSWRPSPSSSSSSPSPSPSVCVSRSSNFLLLREGVKIKITVRYQDVFCYSNQRTLTFLFALLAIFAHQPCWHISKESEKYPLCVFIRSSVLKPRKLFHFTTEK